MKDVVDIEVDGYQRVVKCRIGEKGLTAIIAIHDTTLGPALGGTRMWSYASEDEALQDVLRLSRDMTYKAAAAGLKLGGGKSVIIGDPKSDKSEELFRDFGRFVESLEGMYIASEDVGTEVADIQIAREETAHVVGTDPARGGSGDPSPMTALGVFHGMRACLEAVFGDATFAGRSIAIQGVGKVGSCLAAMLVEAGAEVIVADIDDTTTEAMKDKVGVRICMPDEIYDQPCDIFSPCAMGGVLSDETIPRLRCRIIAGGANNQIEQPEHAEQLHQRGILYAPDYVINAGGLINVASELNGFDHAKVERRVGEIYGHVADVVKRSKKSGVSPLRVADSQVEKILRDA